MRWFYALAMQQLGRRCGLHVFRVLRTPLDPAAPRPDSPGIEIRLMSASDITARCGDPGLDLSRDRVREALLRGDVCVGALQNGELIGYVWFAYRTAPHVGGVWVDFPPQAVYRYKSFVRPEWRGKRIAALLYGFANRLFAEKGRQHVLLCIATHNFASIAAATRAGAQTVGHLAYWQLGRRFLSFHSGAVVRQGLRFFTPAGGACGTTW
jgi:GNAT superfamily N-acetyltransferase